MSAVLLIEPDIVLARQYTQILEHEGHNVTWCQSAQTAIAAADQTKPDVVLLELQLAGHNGSEFLYEFRSYPEWRSVPVIILSLVSPEALGINQFIMEQLNIAAHYYKPLTNLQTLSQVVNQLLEPTVS